MLDIVQVLFNYMHNVNILHQPLSVIMLVYCNTDNRPTTKSAQFYAVSARLKKYADILLRYIYLYRDLDT